MATIARRLPDRFKLEPVINKETGELRTVDIQPNDIRLFHALAYHYHYLSPEYIAPLLGISYRWAAFRTRMMRHPDTKYLRLSPEQEAEQRNHYYGNLFYALGPQGYKVLDNEGIEPPKRPAPYNLKHAAMVDQIMASIEIGVNADPRFEILWWEDLLARGRITAETKPYIELSKEHTAHPDRYPFVLKRHLDGKHEPMLILHEAETGTHSFPDVRQKFKNYIKVLTDKLYKEWGGNAPYIFFYTPKAARLDKFMKDLAAETESDTELRKHFAFQTHPLYKSEEKPRPDAHVFIEPHLRVGYPPIFLNQPLNNTVL